MNTISDLHKHLILSGFTKLSGISPPHGNKKPLEQLSPGDLKLYFEPNLQEEITDLQLQMKNLNLNGYQEDYLN